MEMNPDIENENKNIISISGGLALNADGYIYSFGDNFQGQLGLGYMGSGPNYLLQFGRGMKLEMIPNFNNYTYIIYV